MAQLTLRPSMISSCAASSSPASCSGRSQIASIKVPVLTGRQPLHNGSRSQTAARLLAYRGGNCDYGGGTYWSSGPSQMGGAIANMMEMARKWQASNPSFPQGGGNHYPMQLPLLVDFEEGEEAYTLTADVPGLQKSDLKITVNQKERTLKVSGERERITKATAEPVESEEQPQEQPKKQQYRRRFERMMGKFQRTLSWMPDDADLSAVSARVEKGVLTITVQKAEQEEDNDISEINIE